MYEMLDPQFLEADAYGLFSKLMQRMEVYYKIRNVQPNASGEIPSRSTSDSSVHGSLCICPPPSS